MILPGGKDERFLYADAKPIHPLDIARRLAMWTPRELIESLEKWDPDVPIEVHMQNNPLGGPFHPIIMTQGTNSINLNGKD